MPVEELSDKPFGKVPELTVHEKVPEDTSGVHVNGSPTYPLGIVPVESVGAVHTDEFAIVVEVVEVVELPEDAFVLKDKIEPLALPEPFTPITRK